MRTAEFPGLAHLNPNLNPKDITIKISDEGGGIPRSEMTKVWTYLHSTAKRPPSLTKEGQRGSTACLAGYGVGMPLSRLYAEYFGGGLDVKSMESYGTDCFIHLNRLGKNCENLPETMLRSAGNQPSAHEIEWTESDVKLRTQEERRAAFYRSGLAAN